jgi:hypothetical protein
MVTVTQVGTHCDRDEYRDLLKEKARLDEQYDQLFRRALDYGLPPLTVDDDQQEEGVRITVNDYIGNLQEHRGNPGWKARSCRWVGEATLYEVVNPRSCAPEDQGRRLCLPRQADPGFRDDLASIDTDDLCYPPGPPERWDESPWEARAAEASY